MIGKILHVGKPNNGDRQLLHRLLDDILDRDWLTNDGELVRILEKKLQERWKVKHVIAVSNGTMGLQVAAKALGLTGEVIMPAFTFYATPQALTWIGLKPVFCDVDPSTHNIDPDKIKPLISNITTAIMGVHLWGRACDTEAIGEIAKDNGLKVIYDAAHAFDIHKYQWFTEFGDCSVFSFHATKIFHTCEGGAIATNNDELADRCRQMRNYGFQDGEIKSFGINAKMSEIHAAFGLANLLDVDKFIEICQRNYIEYSNGLRSFEADYFVIEYDQRNQRNNYQYVVLENVQRRDELMNFLVSHGVLARRYFYPGCHKLPGMPRAKLPHSDKLANELLCLPNGIDVTEEDIKMICGLIKEFYQ